MTTLANADSREGIRQGSGFCGNVAPPRQQMMAARGAAELARIAADRRLRQVHAAPACAAPAETLQAGITRTARAAAAER